MDTAQLLIRFVSAATVQPPGDVVEVFSQSDECHKCTMLPTATLAENTNASVTVQTRFPIAFRVVDLNDTHDICTFRYHFAESGRYKFVVSSSGGPNMTSCSDLQELSYEPAMQTYLPLLIAFLILFSLGLLWALAKWLLRRYSYVLTNLFSYQHFVHADLGNPSTINNASHDQPAASSGGEDAGSSGHKKRLRSLDAFRGLSLVLMIFVNYGGGGYWFLNHSVWDGLTVADLLFPWFVWIMGVAIAVAFRRPIERGDSRLALFIKVARRSVILFLLGLIINTDGCQSVPLSQLRIMGVLQRLAISYFVVASLEILFAKQAITPLSNSSGSFVKSTANFFWDLVGSAPQWLVMGGLVVLHTGITFLLPVPDCPRGYLGPGGLADESSHWNCTGGAAQYVDRVVLGESHMYQNPTCKGLYQTSVPFDPEGLLGCLTTIVTCYLGLHAGRILTLFPTTIGRLGRWLNWAVIWGLAAGLLCDFSQFDGVIPVNKNLWSLSFVLALGSMALLLLSGLYVLCDVMRVWSGAPFIYPGMNSIVVYMLHEVLAKNFPVSFAVDDVHWQKLAMNIWGASLWTAVAAGMYYLDVFIAI